MSERLSAIYQGHPVCTFSLLDENNQYIEEVRSELRMASQEGKLFCPDCKNRLVLCAGPVRMPYFRHFDIGACNYSMQMRTEAGKRKYLCRKLLYQLVQQSNYSFIEIDEKGLTPIIFSCADKKVGYVYLDGKTRNYKILRDEVFQYHEKGIELYFFLSAKYMTNGSNLTSDEAEIARLNHQIIFYIDEKDNTVYMRKAYKNSKNVREYYTQKYEWKKLQINESGELTQEYLHAYQNFVNQEMMKFSKVIRVLVEDGIDEIYAQMDYVLMDALGEIWILPEFANKIDGYETDRKRRIQFLEEMNKKIKEEDFVDLRYIGYQLQKQIEMQSNSWDWR